MKINKWEESNRIFNKANTKLSPDRMRYWLAFVFGYCYNRFTRLDLIEIEKRLDIMIEGENIG